MPWARPSAIELNTWASRSPYSQSTSRRLGPMPPPARPPWHPEQLKRTNSCRPSPVAVRLLVYGFGAPGGSLARPALSPGGPGTGPTAVTIGGGAAVAPPLGGVGPHEAALNASTSRGRHHRGTRVIPVALRNSSGFVESLDVVER